MIETSASLCEFESLEENLGGRLGIASLDTGTGRRFGHRGDQRFPLCSTFKLLLAVAVLKRVDAGELKLFRQIAFSSGDLVPNSPFCSALGPVSSASVKDLCRAAVAESDNTASNLLLATLGGPTAITDFARSLGDEMTRLDRWEPELNEALPDDERDTTTPDAMIMSLKQIFFEGLLSDSSRKLMLEWMLACATGFKRIRSGVPEHWAVGHKTGTGRNGSMADVGIICPPAQPPVLLAIYMRDSTASLSAGEAAIALATEWVMQRIL